MPCSQPLGDGQDFRTELHVHKTVVQFPHTAFGEHGFAALANIVSQPDAAFDELSHANLWFYVGL